MTDYSKWDKLEDSDDENQQRDSQNRSKTATKTAVVTEEDRELQDSVDRWLRQQILNLPSDLFDSGLAKPSAADRRTLARFLVVNHFEDNSTNIVRHRDIVDIMRHAIWLEDVSALQFLCCLHRLASQLWDPHDYSVRMMLYSAINTLAAPKLGIEPPGHILDLFAVISDPETPQQWALRERYQKKEFAKTAIKEAGKPKGEDAELEDFSPDHRKAMTFQAFADYGHYVILILISFVLLFKMTTRLITEGSVFGDMSNFGPSPGVWQYARAIMEL